MVSLDPEVPCRDTDPCREDNKGTTSPDTGLAFTIDFGEGDDDVEEKARRFERFALRSSQRKVKSPRQEAKAAEGEEGGECEAQRGEERGEEALRKKAEDARRIQEERRRGARGVRAAWQPGKEKGGGGSDLGVLRNSDEKRGTQTKKESSGDKASLAKMMASLSKGSTSFTNDMTGNNNNNNENDYEEDSFDEDSDEEEEDEEEEGRALSETGTYVLDKEEEEKQKARSRDLLRLSEETSRPGEDASSYVAEWAVRHGTVVGEETSLSLDEGRRRRLLPVTPGSPSTGTVSPESGPPSMSPRGKIQPPLIPSSAKLPKEASAPLEAAEAWRRRKNYKPVLPGSLPSRKPGPQPLKAVARAGQQPSSAPSSARSASSESSGYHSRAASASQPKTGLTKSAPSRSISSLTSKEAEFQAWRRRKNYRPGQMSSSSSSSAAVKKTIPHSSSSSSSGISQVAKSSEGKSRVKVTSSLSSSKGKGLVVNNDAMQRANSFHYENKRLGASPAMARCVEESEDETENDFYLDGDELIMPVYPTRHHRNHEKYACESFTHDRSPSRSRSSDLDNLVISTLHNVSSKLCLASSDMLRKATKLIPEGDEDQAVTVETVQYLLEDTDLPTSPKKRTSRELSGTLKNLKKLEQVMDILNKVLEEGDAD